MILKPDYIFDNIESVPLELLKQHKIKCLLVDIDNTLAQLQTTHVMQAKLDWLDVASSHFFVVLISNNRGKRITEIATQLGFPTYTFALKPISRAYRKIKNLNGFTKHDIAVIGDQLFTDILGGKLQKFLTIYVKPISEKDSVFTYLSRKLERIIMKDHVK